MIQWSIQAALKSDMFDHIMVSTDDEEIATVSRKAGATTPFLRPIELADDFTPTVPVIAHALAWAEQNIGDIKSVCCIYATAPFIRAEDIVLGAKMLERTGADYSFPVTNFPFPVQRGIRLTDEGRAEMLSPEFTLTRSQDLEEAYHDVGQFYWGQRDAWANGHNLMGPNAAPLIIERYRAQDIDTPEDWKRAEIMFQVIEQMEKPAK